MKHKVWSFLGIVGLIVFVAWFCLGRISRPEKLDLNELAYYRAVYILQQMDSPIHQSSVFVPEYVKRHDSTENYLHHSDKWFILKTISHELDECTDKFPDAPLYLGYALFTLGEFGKAAQVLETYVAEAPYNPQAYSVLCSSLEKTQDFTSQYLMSKEWEAKDPSCHPSRTLHMWSALFATARYVEAERLMKNSVACVGISAPVLQAKALLAQGKGQEAEMIIAQSCLDFPTEKNKILQLWEREKQ